MVGVEALLDIKACVVDDSQRLNNLPPTLYLANHNNIN